MCDMFKESPFTIWFDKNGKHVVAFVVIVLLTASIIGLAKYSKIQEEINENCGWGEDDYYCFCEKSDAMKLKNEFRDKQGEVYLNFTNP